MVVFLVNAPVCESLCFFGYEIRVVANHVVLKNVCERVGY